MSQARRSPGRSMSQARRSPSRSGFDIARTRNDRSSGFRGIDPRRRGDNSYYGGSPLGGLLDDFLSNGYGRGYGFDPYKAQEEHAEAIRDAAIAHAVVDIVGILATASQPREVVVQAPPEPRGHVEHQRILVQEGRTEEYQVWVPQYTIPETGEVVVGHHQTRRREIPPVYEDREVWVPAR